MPSSPTTTLSFFTPETCCLCHHQTKSALTCHCTGYQANISLEHPNCISSLKLPTQGAGTWVTAVPDRSANSPLKIYNLVIGRCVVYGHTCTCILYTDYDGG